MTMERKWIDNAFWETPKKELLNCIAEFADENGKTIRQVYKLRATDDDGNANELWDECIEQLGRDLIDDNTDKRSLRKEAETELQRQKEIEHQKAKRLEKLFEYKLETFEIPEIKNSKNRAMKSKLRRAKSVPEVNLYAMFIVKESFEEEWTSELKDMGMECPDELKGKSE